MAFPAAKASSNGSNGNSASVLKLSQEHRATAERQMADWIESLAQLHRQQLDQQERLLERALGAPLSSDFDELTGTWSVPLVLAPVRSEAVPPNDHASAFLTIPGQPLQQQLQVQLQPNQLPHLQSLPSDMSKPVLAWASSGADAWPADDGGVLDRVLPSSEPMQIAGTKPLPAARSWTLSMFATGADWSHSSLFRARFVKLVKSTPYNVFCSSIILLNTVFVGVNAQLTLQADFRHLQDPALPADDGMEASFASIDHVFCAWFTAELVLNLAVDPKAFVYGESRRWNLFDAVLVANCLLEGAMEGAVPNIGDYVRTLRVFRTARVLRIVRVFKVFTSLRLMVFAIVQSLVSLLWVFLLLVLLMYVFAIFFLNAADEYARRPTVTAGDSTARSLNELYGTVPRCLFSLFMAVSGGMDWHDLLEPLVHVSYWYRYIYGMYVFFVVMGVFNVVTGAFVDSFVVVSQRDRDVVIEEEIRREKKYVQDIQRVFEGADKDGSGCLTLEEFEAHLLDSRVKAFFRTLELDTSQARALFVLLDTDDTNEVGIDEFVSGCLRLKGEAKNIDVNMLLYENEYMIQRICAFVDKLERHLGISSDGGASLDAAGASLTKRITDVSVARREGLKTKNEGV